MLVAAAGAIKASFGLLSTALRHISFTPNCARCRRSRNYHAIQAFFCLHLISFLSLRIAHSTAAGAITTLFGLMPHTLILDFFSSSFARCRCWGSQHTVWAVVVFTQSRYSSLRFMLAAAAGAATTPFELLSPTLNFSPFLTNLCSPPPLRLLSRC